MAKKAAKKSAKKKPAVTKTEYKYGVPELGKLLDIEPASVRVGLRNKKVKKNADGVYGWNSEKDFKAVAAKWDTEKKSTKED